jgi:hypothetical protein
MYDYKMRPCCYFGQGQNQDNQRAIQHRFSFGTPALPPDRNVVNQSGSFETGFAGLTAVGAGEHHVVA